MLKELSWRQLLEWRAFDKLSPIGGRRLDWQTAAICATLVNLQLARTRSRKTVKPADFLLEWKETVEAVMERDVPESPRRSWQEMKSIAMMFAAADKADREKKANREAKKTSKRKKRHG